MKHLLSLLILSSLILSACGQQAAPTITVKPTASSDPNIIIYTDPSQPVEARVEDLLKRMTLDEKIGQMTQVEKNSIKPGDINKYFVGSILSGGGASPANNTVQDWYAMVAGYQNEALTTRLKIPMIYGVDAVHGHGNLKDATIFPHNIGLGAANDPALTEKIGRATSEEILATGIPWSFSPVIAVVQDVRWGRTYEGFSENTEIVSTLGAAYIKGMQTLGTSDTATPGQSLLVLATPKHFIGDGGTTWGSSHATNLKVQYMLDQGNMQASESTIRKLFLPPYQAAVNAGAMSMMGSFSSWNGIKLHAQKGLLTDVLKGELGFNGFVVSDWKAIDEIYPDDYYKSVVTSINAGVDMNMVPYSVEIATKYKIDPVLAKNDYVAYIEIMKRAVSTGDIPESRVDEAVRRILRAKFSLGLFEHPMPDKKYQATVRSPEHLELARQAVRESLVLLKNENNALPLQKDVASIYVAGEGANDIGLQSGGWTLEWQGKKGNDDAGTTILKGIEAVVSAKTQVTYNQSGSFKENAEVGIVVVSEGPYAEGVGDAHDLRLSAKDFLVITNIREHVKKLIIVTISGRPLVITKQFSLGDAWVAAWLPGTEGAGITDVLFGDYPFTGKTPYSWPRTNEQLPINVNNAANKTGCAAPLFPFGYGLSYGQSSLALPECNP